MILKPLLYGIKTSKCCFKGREQSGQATSLSMAQHTLKIHQCKFHTERHHTRLEDCITPKLCVGSLNPTFHSMFHKFELCKCVQCVFPRFNKQPSLYVLYKAMWAKWAVIWCANLTYLLSLFSDVVCPQPNHCICPRHRCVVPSSVAANSFQQCHTVKLLYNTFPPGV